MAPGEKLAIMAFTAGGRRWRCRRRVDSGGSGQPRAHRLPQLSVGRRPPLPGRDAGVEQRNIWDPASALECPYNRVDDATAGHHPLGVSGVDHTGIAGAIEVLKRAVQHKCDGFDPAMRMPRESVPGHPILGHKQKWIAETWISAVDEAAGSMPRDRAGLELWVRN